MKASKKDSITLNKLHVGNDVFTGKDVGKGFFTSISSLKSRDVSSLESCPTFQEFVTDHNHILEICKLGKKIPLLSYDKAEELLRAIRPSVTDFYSISALHYLNGRSPAINHFKLILNAVLSDIETFALSQLNTCHAIILFKGHGKCKTSDRSYRTISSCSFIAKAADKYIGWLEEDKWAAAQAETQFQGKGLSHEHAALLLTEAINFSVSTAKLPVFCLYLDAKSAFDRALREILIRRMYLDGTAGHSLLYLDKRLGNRVTFIDWEKTIMGQIHDEQGVEQGGPNSSEEYKIYNNEQLVSAQDSKFGVSIGPITVSCVGQADDSVLLSHDIHQLGHLLHLTTQYCKKYKVEMTPEKTKLQVFAPPSLQAEISYAKSINYLSISDVPLHFSDITEHV